MRPVRLLFSSNVIHRRDGVSRQVLDFRVLVRNRTYDKTVEIHWAGEDAHWYVLPASFLGQISSEAELWHAHAEFPAARENDPHLPGDISFAVRCRCGDREDWDSNHGTNHGINADSGLRLGNGLAVLQTDWQPWMQPAQDFLPITVATHSPAPPQRVFVRWSTDRWRTFTDAPCYFWRRHWHAAMGSAARNPNRYGTQIWISQLGVPSAFRVEYAIASESETGTVWDNNFGGNFLVRRPPLRVLTLNLHCNQEENQDAKLSLIAQVIREFEIDVVCLQEVAEPWNEGHGEWAANTANVIRNRIGRPYHVHSDWSHLGFGRFRESCAIVSRYPFIRTDSLYVSAGQEPTDIHSRRAVMAQLHVPYIGRVNVFSAHLSWWDCGFADQFGRLRHWIGTHVGSEVVATVVAGDFNNNTMSAGYALATQGGELVDQFAIASPRSVYGDHGAPPAAPGPAADPNRIDFIFLRRGDRLAAVAARELFTDSVHGRVSDHTGYMVEFEPR